MQIFQRRVNSFQADDARRQNNAPCLLLVYNLGSIVGTKELLEALPDSQNTGIFRFLWTDKEKPHVGKNLDVDDSAPSLSRGAYLPR